MQTKYCLKEKEKKREMPLPPSKKKRYRNRLLHVDTKRNRLHDYLTLAARKKAWGVSASFDIYGCDPAIIRDADKIRAFVVELCDLIDMKRFGETMVVHFGEDERVAGFSMMQLIETSLISAHFANQSNTTYLDVFSCKPYDPAVVEEFALRFFGGSRCITHVTLRL